MRVASDLCPSWRAIKMMPRTRSSSFDRVNRCGRFFVTISFILLASGYPALPSNIHYPKQIIGGGACAVILPDTPAPGWGHSSPLPGGQEGTFGEASPSKKAHNDWTGSEEGCCGLTEKGWTRKIDDGAVFLSAPGNGGGYDKSLQMILGEGDVGDVTWAEWLEGGGWRGHGEDRKGLGLVRTFPSSIDWGFQFVFSPVPFTFTVMNLCATSALHVHSISSTMLQFYAAYFEPFAIPPASNGSFTAMFLARGLGSVYGTISVETSSGAILVMVHGHGIPSPYGLESLVGYQIPDGQRLMYGLTLHNPYDTALRVVEALTPDAFLVLHPPTDRQNRAEDGSHSNSLKRSKKSDGRPGWLWEVSPHSTATILEVEFVGPLIGRYAGILQIKVQRESRRGERRAAVEEVVMPVDLLTVGRGLKQIPGSVNFGTVTVPHHEVVREVGFMNPGSLPIAVLDCVDLGNDLNILAIEVDKGRVIPPGTSANVIRITYRGLHETRPGGSGLGLTPESDRSAAFGSSADRWWWDRRLVVLTNCTFQPTLELKYMARVIHGSLAVHRADSAHFLLDVPPVWPGERNHARKPPPAPVKKGGKGAKPDPSLDPVSHAFGLVNLFSFPVAILGVRSSDENIAISGFKGGQTVHTNAAILHFTVTVDPKPYRLGWPLPANPNLIIATNLTEIAVPLVIGSCRLAFSVQGEAEEARWQVERQLSMDFGDVSVGFVVRRHFNITNTSPTSLPILDVRTSLSELNLEFEFLLDAGGQVVPAEEVGVRGETVLADGKVRLRMDKLAKKGKPTAGGTSYGWGASVGSGKVQATWDPLFILQSGQTAAMVVWVEAGKQTGGRSGVVEVSTPFETQDMVVTFSVVSGVVNLAPLPIVFPSSFPGRLLKKRIYATSTFSKPIGLEHLRSADPRFVVELSVRVLSPGVKTEIGSVVFDPRQVPALEDYMGDVGRDGQWVGGGGKVARLERKCMGEVGDEVCEWAPGVSDQEVVGMGRRDEIWGRLGGYDDEVVGPNVTASLVLHTSVVSTWAVAVKASLSRPQVLAESKQVEFPQTQVGTTVEQYLWVTNPSDGPIRMQLIVGDGVRQLDCSGEGEEVWDWRRADESPKWLRVLRGWGWGWGWGVGRREEQVGPFWVSASALTDVVVAGKGKARLGPVGFSPQTPCPVAAKFFVRNNLTHLEAVSLGGRGGSGVLKIGGDGGEEVRMRISGDQLGFSDSEPWTAQTRGGGKARLREVSQKFQLVNRGNLALNITQVRVAHRSLSSLLGGRALGFTVSPSGSFSLDPHKAVDLLISHTPDCSASQIHRLLHVATSAGPRSFPLVALLPPHLLGLCSILHPPPSLLQLLQPLCLAGLSALLLLLARAVIRELTIAPSPWWLQLSPAAAAAVTELVGGAAGEDREVEEGTNKTLPPVVSGMNDANPPQQQWMGTTTQTFPEPQAVVPGIRPPSPEAPEAVEEGQKGNPGSGAGEKAVGSLATPPPPPATEEGGGAVGGIREVSRSNSGGRKGGAAQQGSPKKEVRVEAARKELAEKVGGEREERVVEAGASDAALGGWEASAEGGVSGVFVERDRKMRKKKGRSSRGGEGSPTAPVSPAAPSSPKLVPPHHPLPAAMAESGGKSGPNLTPPVATSGVARVPVRGQRQMEEGGGGEGGDSPMALKVEPRVAGSSLNGGRGGPAKVGGAAWAGGAGGAGGKAGGGSWVGEGQVSSTPKIKAILKRGEVLGMESGAPGGNVSLLERRGARLQPEEVHLKGTHHLDFLKDYNCGMGVGGARQTRQGLTGGSRLGSGGVGEVVPALQGGAAARHPANLFVSPPTLPGGAFFGVQELGIPSSTGGGVERMPQSSYVARPPPPPTFVDVHSDPVLERAPPRWTPPLVPTTSALATTNSKSLGGGLGGGLGAAMGGGLGGGLGSAPLGAFDSLSPSSSGALDTGGESVYDIWGNHFAEMGPEVQSLLGQPVTRPPVSSPFGSPFPEFSVFSQAPIAPAVVVEPEVGSGVCLNPMADSWTPFSGSPRAAEREWGPESVYSGQREPGNEQLPAGRAPLSSYFSYNIPG